MTTTDPRTRLNEIKARAEAQAAAYQRMLDLNGGVGLLGVREPAMHEDMLVWLNSTENDHADTVLTMAAALTEVLKLHEPIRLDGGGYACSECDWEVIGNEGFPCGTVRAITEKLGGDRG